MIEQRMNLKRIMPLVLLVLTALVMGCGKEEGGEAESQYGKKTNEGLVKKDTTEVEKKKNDTIPSNTIPKLTCYFRGVWSVDGVSVDTLNVEASTSDSRNILAFYGFPYRTLVKEVAPQVKVTKITNDIPTGATLHDEDSLYFQTLKNLDFKYDFIEASIGEYFRCIGISDSGIYLELYPKRIYAVSYLLFVVTTDQGNYFPVIVSVVPDKSTAVLDIKGKSFSCVLTISQIESQENGEQVIKKYDPELKLKFTSIYRL
jgi:hypothetical protein